MSGVHSPHPSRLELERLATDDLTAAARAEAEVHVVACTACSAYVSELLAATEQRLARVPPAAFLARHRQRRAQRRRRLAFLWTGALALGATAAVLVIAPRRGLEPSDIRLKGLGMSVYRKRGGEIRRLAPGDGIRSGDALRVVLTLPQAGPVWVAAVDVNGRIDPLVPGGVLTVGGGEQPLAESAVVESPCLDMWLIAWPGGRPDEAPATLQRALPSLHADLSALPASVLVRFIRCE